MPKTHKAYLREFKKLLVEMVRGGRTPAELAEKFEPTAQSIRNWVTQADRDDGRRADGLPTEGREELRRLRRENKVLREEREILKNHRGGSLPPVGQKLSVTYEWAQIREERPSALWRS